MATDQLTPTQKAIVAWVVFVLLLLWLNSLDMSYSTY